MFNFDWFHHGGLTRLIEEAKDRCASRRFSQADGSNGQAAAYDTHRGELSTRIILYMKDGLTYEMKELVDIGMSSALTFECTPMDDAYKVGAIVLIVPFEDIARVEVFAVHPDEKPQENLRIGGFHAGAERARE